MRRFFDRLAQSEPIARPLLAGAVALTLLGPVGAQAADFSGATIGSGSVGADFFVLGTSLQKLLSQQYPNARVENTSTTGSVENFRLLRSGDIDIGLFTTTTVVDAWDATGAFADEKPYKEIRALAGMFHFSYNIITLADSGIKTMMDLKGKRVGIGPDPKTLTPLYSPFFDASGVNYDTDIEHVYASYADIFRMLSEGRVDAVVGFTSGFKVPASIQELASSREIRWIPMDKKKLEAAGLEPVVFPPGTLPDEDREIVGCKIGFVALATTTKMSDDDAYDVVKAIHENLKELTELQPAVGEALHDPSTLTAKTTPYPYHPGAIKYWKEVGLWKD